MPSPICPTTQAQSQAQPRKMGQCAASGNRCVITPIIHHKIFVRRRTRFCRVAVCLRLSVWQRSVVAGRRFFGGEHVVFVSLVA